MNRGPLHSPRESGPTAIDAALVRADLSTTTPMEGSTEGGEPPKRSSLTRDVLLAGVSAVLGAGLGIGGSVIQENMSLAEHPPAISITGVQAFSPEITIPNPNKPAPPASIDKQVEVLRHYLGVSDKEMNVSNEDAKAIIDANIGAGLALQSIETPLGYIRVDAWLANVQVAAKTITGFYTQQHFLDELQSVLSDQALTDDQAKGRFIQILEKNVDHDDSLAHLATAYQVDPSDAVVKDIEAQLPELVKQTTVYDFIQAPAAENSPLKDQIFPIGKAGIALRSANNVGRAIANQKVAVLISKFDRTHLAQLAKLASNTLQSERSHLETFMTESDRFVSKRVKPRIVVKSSAFNGSKAPLTITPHAALRVSGANGLHVDILLDLLDVSNADKPEMGPNDDGISNEHPVKYATVESGKLANLRWSGEFIGAAEQWDSLKKAYESGSMTCELGVETVGGHHAKTVAAPFGVRSAATASASAILDGPK